MESQFISEHIEIIKSDFIVTSIPGQPSCPRTFKWRNETYTVERILDQFTTRSKDKGGSNEMYVRKHWFRIKTTNGMEMEIYMDRQAKLGNKKKRWWLFALKK